MEKYFAALVVSAIFLTTAHPAFGDARADLESLSPEIRAAAAKILRETYQPPSREPWDKLVATLKLGDPESKVLELFHPLDNRGGSVMHNWVFQWYQLDDAWCLQCAYDFKIGHGDADTGGLEQFFLILHFKEILVPPPKNYTGDWTLYYANGQPFRTSHYKNGRLGKETFYDQGGKSRP